MIAILISLTLLFAKDPIQAFAFAMDMEPHKCATNRISCSIQSENMHSSFTSLQLFVFNLAKS